MGDDERPVLAVRLGLAPHPEGGWYRRTWTAPTTVTTPYGTRPTATAILYLLDAPGRWHRVRSTELWCWHAGSPVELRLAGTGATPDDRRRALRLGPPDGADPSVGALGPAAEGPGTVGPTIAGPGTVEPTIAGPSTSGPSTIGPSTTGPGTTGPSPAGTGPAGSGTAASGPIGRRGDAWPGTAGAAPQVEVPPQVWQAARPLGDEPALVSCVVSPGFDFADFELLTGP